MSAIDLPILAPRDSVVVADHVANAHEYHRCMAQVWLHQAEAVRWQLRASQLGADITDESPDELTELIRRCEQRAADHRDALTRHP